MSRCISYWKWEYAMLVYQRVIFFFQKIPWQFWQVRWTAGGEDVARSLLCEATIQVRHWGEVIDFGKTNTEAVGKSLLRKRRYSVQMRFPKHILAGMTGMVQVGDWWERNKLTIQQLKKSTLIQILRLLLLQVVKHKVEAQDFPQSRDHFKVSAKM